MAAIGFNSTERVCNGELVNWTCKQIGQFERFFYACFKQILFDNLYFTKQKF